MRTAIDGPYVIYGNDNPQQISNTEAGPNIDYQSNALIDPRTISQATAAGEGAQAGVLCWHNPVELETLSAIPATLSNTAITSSQTPAASAFFALNTAAGLPAAANIPLIPQGNGVVPGSNAIVNVLALDFGFALVTTTTAAATAQVLTVTGPTPTPAGSASAVYATRFFYPGQRIIVAAAGNAAGTAPLFAVVTATDRYASPGVALAAAGTVTINTPALFASTNLQVGTSDQEYGVTAQPVVKAGAARCWDPAQLISRVVTVTNGVGGSGFVTVRGYDIYGQPMSQIIAITASTTVAGTKAFKYISSVQANAGAVTTGGVSIGTADIIGIPMRADTSEYLNLFYQGAPVVAVAGSQVTGFVAADQTTPATNTSGGSGDVRGTYLLLTASNGSKRIVLTQYEPIATAKLGTNIDVRALVGVTNA
jgi:hypothetical protein